MVLICLNYSIQHRRKPLFNIENLYFSMLNMRFRAIQHRNSMMNRETWLHRLRRPEAEHRPVEPKNTPAPAPALAPAPTPRMCIDALQQSTGPSGPGAPQIQPQPTPKCAPYIEAFPTASLRHASNQFGPFPLCKAAISCVPGHHWARKGTPGPP